MPFKVQQVLDRQTLANNPENDFQAWQGIAGDGNSLHFSRIRSAQKRCWCTLSNPNQFIRLTQGLSFNGHFIEDGEPVIATNQAPGLKFKISFAPPVSAVGLDVEPMPAAVVPGQRYRVILEVANTTPGDTFQVNETGHVGTCHFVGAQCDTDAIAQMEIRVTMIDGKGNDIPVDFGINRLELLAPPGNSV